MSLYNMINGVNPATFFILPMLGKHPDEYPRFRDCFIEERHGEIADNGMPVMRPKEGDDGKPKICIYTRVGGGNRESYEKEIIKLRKTDGYIKDFDDDFDSTFATFVFAVPEKYLPDFKLITEGKLLEISEDYKKQLYLVYPKLKDKFDATFAKPR